MRAAKETKEALGMMAATLVGSTLFTLPVSAGPILLTYTGPGGATVNLPLASGGNLNVYAYPYYLSAVPAMCDDARTDTNPGEKWYADVNFISTNLTSLKWYSALVQQGGVSEALLTYEEAAVIFYEGATGKGVVADGTKNGTNAAEGNVAVWYLFSNSSLYNGQYAVGDTPEINAIIAAAKAVVDQGNFDYSQVVFFTPDTNTTLNPLGINQSQEFIALQSVESETLPEPATYALLGTGLMTLGWLGRRRLRRT